MTLDQYGYCASRYHKVVPPEGRLAKKLKFYQLKRNGASGIWIVVREGL